MLNWDSLVKIMELLLYDVVDLAINSMIKIRTHNDLSHCAGMIIFDVYDLFSKDQPSISVCKNCHVFQCRVAVVYASVLLARRKFHCLRRNMICMF